MITDNDIVKLKQTFVTKKDLKEELNRFATKEDLEELEIRIGKSFTENQTQINEVKEAIQETNNRITSLEDHLVGELKTLFLENAVNSSHKREINDHEERITKLERATFSN